MPMFMLKFHLSPMKILCSMLLEQPLKICLQGQYWVGQIRHYSSLSVPMGWGMSAHGWCRKWATWQWDHEVMLKATKQRLDLWAELLCAIFSPWKVCMATCPEPLTLVFGVSLLSHHIITADFIQVLSSMMAAWQGITAVVSSGNNWASPFPEEGSQMSQRTVYLVSTAA